MSKPYAGGHMSVTHTDVGALEFLESRGAFSLLDVGCGPGGQVQEAMNRGWSAFGIDVDVSLLSCVQGKGPPNVAIIDLADQPVIFHRKFDVVWSVEVAEHIPEQFEENYITTLVENCKEYLVMTASNIPMPLHFNCKPREHWIAQIEKQGLTYNEGLLKQLLEASTMKGEFLRDTGMVFYRANR